MAEQAIQEADSQSIHEQVLPEEGVIKYSNVYISSNSVSSSSLTHSEENELDNDGKERVHYPPDLLGVSWGSYLHSGPPTRAGLEEPQATSKTKSTNNSNVEATSRSGSLINLATSQPGTTVHGILRTLPTKESAQMSRSTHPEKNVKILRKDVSIHEDDTLLLIKLQDLIKCLSDCKVELETYGLETVPIPNSLLSALNICNKSKTVKVGDRKTEKRAESLIISNRILHDIVEYLRETTERLTEQGKKLNEQALFLHRTGKQLGRNHRSLLEEQAILELASERAQEHLEKEKQDLEAQKEKLQVASKQLQTLLREQQQHGRHNRLSSPHTIAQGRSQLVALKRTQKEQSRLEKIFLQQQREIRNLQREQMSTKSDLHATKEHAERLQHKLEQQVNKIRKSTVLMTSYTYESRVSQGTSKQKEKPGVDKLLANQRTLTHEVERMRHQIADQQRRERQLLHQQDSRHQLLKETGTKLKWQASAVRGGYDYTEYRRPGIGRGKLASKGDVKSLSPYKLPVVGNNKKKRPKKSLSRPDQDESKVSLPALSHTNQPQPQKVELLRHQLTIPVGRSRTENRKKPRFTFSKAELQSLACFRDDETAEQVLEWLDMQGRLSDI